MNTLLIAPDSDLINIPDETRSIQEALNAQVVNGRVTPRIVADAISNRIARRQKIDRIIFIGHGNLTGLMLTNGHISISELCRYIKSAGTRELILNSCESEYIALAIHHETEATVICTVTKVDDEQAYATSRLLAEALANGATIEEAYDNARPSGAGQSTYHIFSKNRQAHIAEDEPEDRMRYMLSEQQQRNDQAFAELKAIIQEERTQSKRQADEHAREIADLKTTVGELKQALADARAEAQAEAKRKAKHPQVVLPANAKIIFAGIYITLFAPVGVFFLEFRNMLEINTSVAYALSLLFYVISFTLASYFFGFTGNRSDEDGG